MNDHNKTFIVLDNVRSAFNVGAIFRTSDASDVTCIYLVGITPKPPLEKLKKTSIGAIDYVEWKYFETIDEAIEDIKKIEPATIIYGIEQKSNARLYYDADLSLGSAAFIVGHEILGVSDRSIALCNQVLELPMHGKKNSLNVATTAGIVLYERARQMSKNS